MQSYPLRVRGLKPNVMNAPAIVFEVVSFTGTWVETKR